jgi:hypothetical protein
MGFTAYYKHNALLIEHDERMDSPSYVHMRCNIHTRLRSCNCSLSRVKMASQIGSNRIQYVEYLIIGITVFPFSAEIVFKTAMDE